jgi:hypothetical protein
MMNEQRKETHNQGKKIEDDQTQNINDKSLKIIDSLYEARMIIHVTGPMDKSEKRVRFQEAQQEENAQVYDGADLELNMKVLRCMPAVQRIEVIYGLSLGK